MKKVRLVKTLNQEEMPIGLEGTVLEGTMDAPGMLLISWDNGHTIPMYRSELIAI
jgi:hypothetical protein